jgi:hypothetical protein
MDDTTCSGDLEQVQDGERRKNAIPSSEGQEIPAGSGDRIPEYPVYQSHVVYPHCHPRTPIIPLLHALSIIP